MRTVTIKPSAGTYASMNAMEAGEDGSLSDDLTVNCDAFADSSMTTFAGWTMNGYSVLIQAASGQQHDGTRSTGYRIVTTGTASAGNITWNDNTDAVNLTLRGLAISATGTGRKGVEYTSIHASSTILIDRCLIYDCTHVGYNGGAAVSSHDLRNIIAVGNTYTGINLESVDGNIYNCIGCGTSSGNGITTWTGTMTVKNCYAGGNSSDGFDGDAAAYTTCASDDGSEGATVAYATGSGAYFTNVTAGSEDFNLSSQSSALYDAGTDLSGIFTDDILGLTRSQWDINAYEEGAGAGAPPDDFVTVLIKAASQAP